MTTRWHGSRMPQGARRALILATLAFMVNFWAWNLLAPLATTYKELLGLGPVEVSVLVAVPVIVGSLGRIPLGSLTDRFGGRFVFALLSFALIVPIAFLATAGSYPALLAGGFVLGLGGASFAVGVPFVSAWFPPERRGLALGIYGLGNIGTSISGFVSPRVVDAAGREWAFLIVVAPLALMGLLFLTVARDAPGWKPATEPFLQRWVAALGLPLVRRLALLYAITFGGFVAFGVYLPTYLVSGYDLSVADAALRAAGFVMLATLARPLGGWLADRYDPIKILAPALAGVTVGATAIALQPSLAVVTVPFLGVAVFLGLGNGAVFALLGRRIPPTQVGSATGLVGCAGGLGGFFPPIVMGLVYQATGSYSIGLGLLAIVALAAAAFTWRGRDVPQEASSEPSAPTDQPVGHAV